MSLEEKTNEVARILKLLSHSKRLLILCKLIKKNRTVGELEEHCAISQSQLSQFLAKMKREKLIESDKKWLFVTYRIRDERIRALLAHLQTTLCEEECS